MARYIHFDWAMKGMLRKKANFDILEGFLTSLLGEIVKIRSILESESNQESADDKFNRVDILAENEYGDLFIVEVQNNRELYYFHRILYGVSKLIVQNIEIGQEYDKIKKVYSINIVYFEIGHGKDYAYHGVTEFCGINNSDDVLELTKNQKKIFRQETVGGILPEYFVLRVENFNREAVTPLDEWISFLKTGNIPDTATAPGLAAARTKLLEYNMSEAERKKYYRDMENLRYQRSVIKTGVIEGEEKGREEGLERGIEKGREEGLAEGIEKGIEKGVEQTVLTGHRNGFTVEQITAFSGLSREKVIEIINRS